VFSVLFRSSSIVSLLLREAGEDDVDVLAWFKAGEPDHLLGEIKDADGFSHIKIKISPPFPIAPASSTN